VAEVGNKKFAGARGLCSRRGHYPTEKEKSPYVWSLFVVSVPRDGVWSRWCLNQPMYVHGVEAGMA